MTHLINMSFGWSASLDFNYFSSMPRSVVVITSGLKSTYLWLTFRSINYGLGSLDAGFRAFYEFRIEKMAPLLAPCLVLQRVIQRFVGYLPTIYLPTIYLPSTINHLPTYLHTSYLPTYLPTYLLATYLPSRFLPFTYNLPTYHLLTIYQPFSKRISVVSLSLSLLSNISIAAQQIINSSVYGSYLNLK